MEEAIGWGIIIIALVFVLLVGYKVIPVGLYWILAVLGALVFLILDQLFSASLFPRVPWLSYCIGGALIGAAFAFWTVAPIYGLRKQRPLIIAAPFALLVFTALIRLMIQ